MAWYYNYVSSPRLRPNPSPRSVWVRPPSPPCTWLQSRELFSLRRARRLGMAFVLYLHAQRPAQNEQHESFVSGSSRVPARAMGNAEVPGRNALAFIRFMILYVKLNFPRKGTLTYPAASRRLHCKSSYIRHVQCPGVNPAISESERSHKEIERGVDFNRHSCPLRFYEVDQIDILITEVSVKRHVTHQLFSAPTDTSR